MSATDLRTFALLVRRMRDKQREFFARDQKRSSTLREAKALERAVDRAVEAVRGRIEAAPAGGPKRQGLLF